MSRYGHGCSDCIHDGQCDGLPNRDGESVKDAVRRLYGRATAKLCDRLIGVCPFITEKEDKDGTCN